MWQPGREGSLGEKGYVWLSPFAVHFRLSRHRYWWCAVLGPSAVADSLRPHGLQPARLLCPWGFSRQYWSGCHCLLQVIFLMQGLNLCLQHCRQILYCWVTREARVVTTHHNLLLTSRYFLFRCWDIFINSSFYCIYHIHVFWTTSFTSHNKETRLRKKIFSSKTPQITENQAVMNSNNFMQVM